MSLNWKHLKCPLIVEWINKLGHSHTMGYSPAMKKHPPGTWWVIQRSGLSAFTARPWVQSLVREDLQAGWCSQKSNKQTPPAPQKKNPFLLYTATWTKFDTHNAKQKKQDTKKEHCK